MGTSTSSQSPKFRTKEQVDQEYDACVRYRANLMEWTNHVYQSTKQLSSSSLKCGNLNQSKTILIPPPLPLQHHAAVLSNVLDAQKQQQQQQYALRSLFPSERKTLVNDCRCRTIGSSFDDVNDDNQNDGMYLLLPQGMSMNDQSRMLRRYISNNAFQGTIVLVLDEGIFPATGGQVVATTPDDNADGIHSNVRIGGGDNDDFDGCCVLYVRSSVCGNGRIRNTLIGPNAIVRNCGHIETTTIPKADGGDDKNNPSWYDVMKVDVGAESGGGRTIVVSPETDLIQVCQQLATNQATAATSAPESSTSPLLFATTMNIVGTDSILCDTSTIRDVIMYPKSRVRGATSLERVVLYPNASIQNGCIVRQSFLQWDTSIVDASVVEHVVLMESSQIGPNSTIHSSLFGPDVHVSCGEVHASILGPNTNAHHQSLVISVLWPLGRGNVGYGANVGSNHTGKLPDQETFAGEGSFWGLGTVIKFPVSLQEAPYTVVAAGTTLPPQRLRMPFSLVLTSTTNGGINTILPGWVLKSSPYTIARSEAKFAQRRKATHHHYYTGWKIIRPETIQLCIWARDSLRFLHQIGGTSHSEQKVYIGDKQILGIGPNELTEKGRIDGIRAYTDCIQRFALHGLLKFMIDHHFTTGGNRRRNNTKDLTALWIHSIVPSDVSVGVSSTTSKASNEAEWQPFPWDACDMDLWEYQRRLLLQEFPLPPPARNGTNTAKTTAGGGDVVVWARDLLQRLIQVEKQFAKQVLTSKQRDDTRGAQTIPGYADTHVSAEDDPAVIQVQADAAETQRKAMDVLEYIERTYYHSSHPQASKL